MLRHGGRSLAVRRAGALPARPATALGCQPAPAAAGQPGCGLRAARQAAHTTQPWSRWAKAQAPLPARALQRLLSSRAEAAPATTPGPSAPAPPKARDSATQPPRPSPPSQPARRSTASRRPREAEPTTNGKEQAQARSALSQWASLLRLLPAGEPGAEGGSGGGHNAQQPAVSGQRGGVLRGGESSATMLRTAALPLIEKSREKMHEHVPLLVLNEPDPRLAKALAFTDRIVKGGEASRRAVSFEALDAGVLDWKASQNEELARASRRLLALIGVADFVERKGNYGIRILSIDGGGTKGLVALEMLKRIEDGTGRPVHEMFDLICGTSTGAIIMLALGAHRWDVARVEAMYKELASDIFATQRVAGGSRMLRGGSYYDTSILEDIFKHYFGTQKMIDTADQNGAPKMFTNASLVSTNPPLPYLFRNYNLPVNTTSLYPGDCQALTWQVLRATTAAPGYFEPMVLGANTHHDGSVLVNNPTALAMHEARRIWGPTTPIECIVSLGTGKQKPGERVTQVSWLGIAETIINSATDSTGIHRIMQDLLQPNVYFRQNPVITEPYINEYRQDRLERYQAEARNYIIEQDDAFESLASVLNQRRDRTNRFKDWLLYHPYARRLVNLGWRLLRRLNAPPPDPPRHT